MEPDKRDIPLTVLEELDKYSKKSSELIKIQSKKGVLLRFVDNHPNPKQYFEFNNFNNTKGKQILTLSIRPKNLNDPTGHSITVEVGKTEPHFKNWITNLERYKKVKIFDDPILNQYQTEFYTEFEILDEDAEINSYPMETQIWLDNYLTQCLSTIEQYGPEHNETIEEIKSDLEDLKENQTRLPKKKVLKSLSSIFAKVRKHGLKLLKEIYVEGKKEFIKQLVTGKIDLL